MPANGLSQTPDWESHREAIERLYLIQNMTQNEVRETLKQEYNFTISENQLKKQLDKWGLATKNVKFNSKQKAALLQLQEGRQKQENKRTEFRRWKKLVDPRTFARFKDSLGNRNIPVLSLVDNSARLSGVSYRTPSINGTVCSRALSVNSSHRAVSRRGSSRASSVAGSSRAPSRASSNRATTQGGRSRLVNRNQTNKRWRRASITEIISKYVLGFIGQTTFGDAASFSSPDPATDSPISPVEKAFNDFINQDMLQHDPEHKDFSQHSSEQIKSTQLAFGHASVVAEQTSRSAGLLTTELGRNAPSIGDKGLPPTDPDAVLVFAVAAGDIAKVHESLGEGANPNMLANSESSVLGLAVMFGWEQIVTALLDGGADIGIHQKDGLLPLHWAIVTDRPALVELLILRGADPNGRGQLGQIPLHLAIREGKETIVNILLEHGANVCAFDCHQWTSLHAAIRWGACTQTLQKLLEYGADIDAKDEHSNTPLHFAANWGTASTVLVLLDYGANVDAENSFHLTPLQTAVSSARDFTIIARLLEYGANSNLEFQDGGTALHKAVFLRANDTVQLLLSSGVEFAPRSHCGQTPLAIAVSYGNLDAVKLLVSHNKGAAAKATIEEGLLRVALKYGRFPIAELLLENAASFNEVDETALHWAASEGSIAAADFLLRRGADIHARDRLQRTPLQIALAREDEPMAGWLSLKEAAVAAARDRDERIKTLPEQKLRIPMASKKLLSRQDRPLPHLESRTLEGTRPLPEIDHPTLREPKYQTRKDPERRSVGETERHASQVTIDRAPQDLGSQDTVHLILRTTMQGQDSQELDNAPYQTSQNQASQSLQETEYPSIYGTWDEMTHGVDTWHPSLGNTDCGNWPLRDGLFLTSL